ncbi:MAG: hypothetical protein JNG86_13170 [Verrucomicrobiaceae bacterium]|nr:hypothetical protein [Verrucomicrobiaceae bacterium]
MFCRFTLFFLLTAALHAQATKSRTWTDARGNQTQAALRGFEAGQVILQADAGKTIRVPIANFSADDQSFVVLHIAEIVDPSAALPVIAAGGKTPASGSAVVSAPVTPLKPMQVLSKPTWPQTLTAPDGLTNADYVERESKQGHHVYRSRRFQYILHAYFPLNPALMKEVARVFEGTYELLSQSPWGVQAQPVDGYFRAHLYDTMSAYYEAGGPKGSAGVYKREERIFMAPLDSLGLKPGQNGYVKDENYEVKTLVHEITHMMMHDILPLLPRWLIEGTAEFTETIPYKSGTFKHADLAGSVKKYNALRFSDRIIRNGPPIESLRVMLTPPRKMSAGGSRTSFVTQTSPVPQMAFYHASMLLTYYFMHLDGDGKGTRLLKFLDAVRAEQPAHAAFGAAFDKYRAEMDEFLKKPDVKSFPDGRFQYPSHLTPPELPKPPHEEYADERVGWIHYNILLDGRTPEQLAQEAARALDKLGLTVVQ